MNVKELNQKMAELSEELEGLRSETHEQDYLWNNDKYRADDARIDEIERELKMLWIRLQYTLGMTVSIASVFA
jgi:predicted RNase H-like nuclease (RuvC/YqgF family)